MHAPVGRRHLVLLNLLVAAVYGALGTVSLLAVRDTGLAAPVWPAAGVAFAAVLAYGWRIAPGVALGSILVNVPAILGGEFSMATAVLVPLAVACGAALQAITGSALVRRFVGPNPPLVDAGSIVRFLLLAGPVACVVAPSVGLAAQLAGGVVPPSRALIVWLTWWVGDSIGVVLFAPMTLMFLPPTKEGWRGRRLKIIVPTLIVLAATTWFSLQDAAVARASQDREATQLAIESAAQLQRALDRERESLDGIRGLILASESVSADEFRTFTRSTLNRLSGLQALSWNTAVPDEELQDFTVRMRLEEGQPSFTVTERDADGNLVPTSSRPEHIVVTYIEPLATNKPAVGFDIASNPTRAEAIEAAIESGEARATAPVDLVQDDTTQKGVLILEPVFEGGELPATLKERTDALRGFAVGVYRFGDLIDTTFADPRWSLASFTLTDVTDPADPIVVAERVAAGEPAAIDPVSRDLQEAGRTWRLSVQPTSEAEWAQLPTYSIAVLLVGLIVTTLLEAFLLLLTGTERQARRQAIERGFEARHDSLTNLYNRRAFLELLESAHQRAEDEASRHVLLFMDLDGFKQVNDTDGHEAGDAMLGEVAGAMRSHVRDRDVLARVGGDEFTAILNNCPEQRGLDIAQSIVDAVEALRLEAFPDAPGISVSVGLAMIDGAERTTIDELLRRADQACYAAKAAGRGQVRAFDRLVG